MFFGKRITALVIFTFIGVNLFAEGNGFTFKPLFGGGGATAVLTRNGGYGIGGYGEYAFQFYENGLQICNHFIGRGDTITNEVGNKYGMGSIIEKISFGGLLPNNFLRTYGFVEGGIGIGGNDEIFAFNIIFGGGGGIDLFFHKNESIYLEAGYLQHSIKKILSEAYQ
ncbi:MAG: hypothetical protein LBH43_14990 [Treponema sp.]|jgi:hypothetical protein|nr:hypothetical protein [Treponema sp.]